MVRNLRPRPVPHHSIAQALEARFYGSDAVRQRLPGVQQDVAEGRQTPFAAAEELLGL